MVPFRIGRSPSGSFGGLATWTTSLTSAPAFSSALTAPICPWRTANSSGVYPESSGVRKSAPALMSSSITSTWPSAAAHISAVCPRRGSFACTSAPRASSARTASTLPVRAAVINIVSPPGSDAFASAPASRNRSTMAALPLVQASDSGVTPYRFAARTSAPAASSRFTRSRSSWYAAQCSAVVPSGCAALTSARLVDQLANGGAIHPLHRVRERRIRRRASHFGGQARSVRKRDDREREQRSAAVAPHVHPQPARSTGLSSVSIFPVLSANESSRTPTLSSSVRCRFASGIGSAYLMWRPPRALPALPPATTIGRFTWSWTFGIAHAAAVQISEWSSSVPSPSATDASCSR